MTTQKFPKNGENILLIFWISVLLFFWTLECDWGVNIFPSIKSAIISGVWENVMGSTVLQWITPIMVNAWAHEFSY